MATAAGAAAGAKSSGWLVLGVLALVATVAVVGGLAVYKGVQWWRGRRLSRSNKKILEDIEMEFATEDDDDELLTAVGSTHVDDDWSCIDTLSDATSSRAGLQSAAMSFGAKPPGSAAKPSPAVTRSNPFVARSEKGLRLDDEDDDDDDEGGGGYKL